MLADLVSNCHYPLRLNPHHDAVSRVSEEWLLAGAHLAEPRITQFMGLHASKLAAACYPDADAFRLRVCTDFLNWLFIMDDWLERSDVDYILGMRERCISAFRDPINFRTEAPGVKMCKSYEVDERAKGRAHDLESYIALRRNTSCDLPCFALIEYAAQIDIPDEVMSHPVIMAMEEAVNDLVAWSNDMFSYNVEQSRGDTHNIIMVIMHEHGLDLQGAMEYCGGLCKDAIQRFEDNRAMVPSWGKYIDEQVVIYVGGLQDWIVGSLHWSFDSTRYFGKDGHIVKQDRIIKLLPKRPVQSMTSVVW
ncbi:terpenoid synthase [Rhizopogon vinicolor AM-OR11-026]|uniref:Terpene synthase n=1 Tax=Rhizopogon vinicolor AM-OR11-026 TaxID=1314800 RepID=A0A1B7N6C8_9AGAM|nr:terpenoid synthase [Rhizopogon vinicolor AM-OR11-026]